jgi:hypothetical protein
MKMLEQKKAAVEEKYSRDELSNMGMKVMHQSTRNRSFAVVDGKRYDFVISCDGRYVPTPERLAEVL